MSCFLFQLCLLPLVNLHIWSLLSASALPFDTLSSSAQSNKLNTCLCILNSVSRLSDNIPSVSLGLILCLLILQILKILSRWHHLLRAAGNRFLLFLQTNRDGFHQTAASLLWLFSFPSSSCVVVFSSLSLLFHFASSIFARSRD